MNLQFGPDLVRSSHLCCTSHHLGRLDSLGPHLSEGSLPRTHMWLCHVAAWWWLGAKCQHPDGERKREIERDRQRERDRERDWKMHHDLLRSSLASYFWCILFVMSNC